ncbi:threonine synthase [candidate division WOR-3 bacterium RBG_13_43_14]|uniref:Threonine synthase n=1 Tax=candidate division WOR-3 bacterium RBG_13_43_14 TaxID=1802590 RepID=A0A1F4UB01_UNCW3|nr:MAG: threonine synthase [candidate division WOR-3 bacterium RBG_13_43_14]
MSFVRYLVCSKCGNKVEPDRLWNLCTLCSKPLIPIYDLKSVRKAIKPQDIIDREPNIWRYRELLPVDEPDNMLTLGEGFSPMLHLERLGAQLGFDNLYIKDEGQNPTGSFKARGMAVAISKARELGVNSISVPSLGNAGSAACAYAALAGIQAYVFMPVNVPRVFVVECIAYGGHVQLIDGLITDCGRQAADELKQSGRFDLSTLKEPYRIEGKKTMGFEIAEQMGWQLPDVIIYPTGGGTGLIGMWKAFEELQNLGWIKPKMPRMVCVQSKGCAPIVQAFSENATSARKWSSVNTIADGLRVPSSIADFMILRALYESRGTAITVSDDEIMKAITEIGVSEGIFCCPEGGATFAAFKQLRQSGWIEDRETVLLFNTASGTKYAHLWIQDLRS